MFVVAVILHLVSVCTNPGIITRPPEIDFFQLLKEFDPVLLCPDCEVIRTDRSRHCSICNKCVERFDHHCPWINNCVGINNHGVFMAFLLSMLTLLITTLYSLIRNYSALDNINVDPTGHHFFYDYILPRDIYLEVSTAAMLTL